MQHGVARPIETTTKFHKWQLPGGTNYKEMLLTLPRKPITPTHPSFEQYKDYYGDVSRSMYEMDIEGGRWEVGLLRHIGADVEGYHSSHWDEPNVLAHVRFNDRTGPNGEKMLFLEEVQSDYGQDYRKQLNNIEKAVDEHFKDVVKSMEKAGVLKEIC
jgi:hypothetical protein